MIYKLFLALMSILGYFVHIYFFIFTLVTLMMEFAVMRVVLKSVFIPLDKVVATLIVTVVFLYWFAGYAYFNEVYGHYDFGYTLPCQSNLLDCV